MSKFLRWIVNIILIVAIVVACGLLIPPLAGVNTVIVDDVDMPTNLNRGSVTYGLPKKASELKVGDDIIVQDTKGDYVYRLKEINATSGQCELEDIKSTDGGTHSETFTKVIPKVLFTVPFIGYVTMAMKSTEGLIIIGLAVIFIIILFILSELWKKDTEEDEEEEEDDQETATPVDMSAHILEKVSSEIGSEVSSVIAGDTDGTDEAISEKAEEVNNDVAGDTMPIEAIAKDDTKEKDDTVKELEKAIANQEGDAKKDVVEKIADNKKEVDSRVDGAKDDKGVDELVEEIKRATADDATEVKDDVADEAAEALVEAPPIEKASEEEKIEELEKEPEEDLEPVEMAMPTNSAEELIAKAKEAGLEPEVEKDENLGITILDYSKLL